jgi:hypothetical protein
MNGITSVSHARESEPAVIPRAGTSFRISASTNIIPGWTDESGHGGCACEARSIGSA